MADDRNTSDQYVNAMHESNIAWLNFVSAAFEIGREIVKSHQKEESPAMKDIRRQANEILSPHANIHGRTNEDRVCAIFDWLIQSDAGIPSLHPGVTGISKEFQTRAGRVDRLLVHSDGTATVVEIKGPGSRRDHACGLGQALVYAAAVREEMPKFHEVRSALFVGGEHDQWLSSACRVSGVAYECIGHKANKMIVEFAAAAYEVMRGNRE